MFSYDDILAWSIPRRIIRKFKLVWALWALHIGIIYQAYAGRPLLDTGIPIVALVRNRGPANLRSSFTICNECNNNCSPVSAARRASRCAVNPCIKNIIYVIDLWEAVPACKLRRRSVASAITPARIYDRSPRGLIEELPAYIMRARISRQVQARLR